MANELQDAFSDTKRATKSRPVANTPARTDIFQRHSKDAITNESNALFYV